MKVLVTGAKGFIGRNLTENLKNIKDGKNRTRNLVIDEIYAYDKGDGDETLDRYCRDTDFVFHLAGVNRPEKPEDYMQGNVGTAERLLELLKKHRNFCPVMLSSSIQAELTGRFEDSEYGKSKLAGEEAFFAYGEETGARVLVYRFPNVFGKWCRPNYNSVVATFCHNTAHDIPLQVDDPATELTLLYIDDLVEEMLDALEGKEHRRGRYCTAPITHDVTLGEIVNLLQEFHHMPENKIIPEIPAGCFAKKLLSTYLSYIPEDKVCYLLEEKQDERGTFTEMIKTLSCGQISVNISKPGATRGEHWHNSKWELFIVVAGHGLIRERKVGTDEVLEFEVSGDRMEAVQMLPGYAHSIRNLSETENLVTIMWANETFDSSRPDTFREEV